MDENGTAALKQFKQHGGVTIVQAPETAGRRGMPTAAIMSGAVDYVLDPEAILGSCNKLRKASSWKLMFIADGELANSGCASSHHQLSEIAQRFGVTQSCQ